LVEIIKKTSDKMKFSITTNGSILNEEFIKLFINNKNIKMTISLDSLDSLDNKKSNMIRKNIDVNKVVENIKKLCEYEEIRERLSIRTTISAISYKDVYDIIKFCEDNKIKNSKINSTNEFGRAKENKELILPFKNFMSLLEELVTYCNQNVKSVNVKLPVEKYLKGINRKCLCGTTSLYVNWYGDIYPCAFTDGKLKLGNIREKKVDMILNEIKNFTHD
jgi:MoaA/NifB/PqqE/SkfB family radical SAM enzyme